MRKGVRMKITPQILTAVQRAVEYYGNTSQVAKAMGIAHSTVFFWLKGKTSSMSGKLWQTRIRPVLAPFMSNEQGTGNFHYGPGNYPADQALVLHEDDGKYHAAHGGKGGDDADAAEQNRLTVIKYETLLQFDPSADSVRKFLKQFNTGTQEYHGFSAKTHFVVRLGSEYTGTFLPGTDLLVSTEEYPANHSIVLARIRESGELVLGRYVRSGNVITIISLSPDAPEISWDCTSSFGYMLWCFQVLEAKLDLRDI